MSPIWAGSSSQADTLFTWSVKKIANESKFCHNIVLNWCVKGKKDFYVKNKRNIRNQLPLILNFPNSLYAWSTPRKFLNGQKISLRFEIHDHIQIIFTVSYLIRWSSLHRVEDREDPLLYHSVSLLIIS